MKHFITIVFETLGGFGFFSGLMGFVHTWRKVRNYSEVEKNFALLLMGIFLMVSSVIGKDFILSFFK